LDDGTLELGLEVGFVDDGAELVGDDDVGVALDGNDDGLADGTELLGNLVGQMEGRELGHTEGILDGCLVGWQLGALEGCSDGCKLGSEEGNEDGSDDGCIVGYSEGSALGATEGFDVGCFVGWLFG
jgi:hypothetical protein